MPIRLRSQAAHTLHYYTPDKINSITHIESAANDHPDADAWTRDELDYVASKSRVSGQVAVVRPKIHVGYILWEHFRERGALEILRFGVIPEFQRQHVGTDLVMHVVRKLIEPGGPLLVECLVPEECLPAQLLLSECGFLAIGVDRDAFGRGRAGFRMVYGGEADA